MHKRGREQWWRCLAGAVVAAALWCGVPATAAEELPDRLHLADLTIVDRPVLEATRFSRYGGQTAVVGEGQVEGLDAHDLATALRRTPGVTISRYNPVGSFGGGQGGAVFVRGQGSSRPGAELQTLVDGVPVYNPVWNHPLLDLLPVGPTSEIEVMKGPQPWLFGNAFSAVNLVPRRFDEAGYATRLSLSLGRYATFTERLDHGGQVGRFDYLLGQSWRRSDGHRSHADGRLGDGYGSLGYALDEHWTVRGFVLHTDSAAHDPGPRGNADAREGRYETRSTLGTLSLSHRYDETEGSLKLYASHGIGDWFDQPDGDGDTLNTWDLYGMRAREALHLWPGGEILLGLDLDWLAGETDFRPVGQPATAFERETLWLASPSAAVSHEFGSRDRLSLTPSLGVRHSRHSDFESTWAPHAGLVLAHRGTELYGAWSRGVSYPGLNTVVFHENFWQAVPTNDPEGWRDLEPERLDHLEIGLRQALPRDLEVTLSAFRDEGRNRYVVVMPPPPPPHFENIAEYTTTGGEATLTWQASRDLSFFVGVTHLRSDPSDLPYAPSWSTSMGLTWQMTERLTLHLDAQRVGGMEVLSRDRTATAANRQSVSAQTIVNGKLVCVLNQAETGPRVRAFVAVENLTDSNYETLPGYPMPGISPSLGVEVSF